MDISPDKQNIDRVFSNTSYFIDFYQRDYRWTDQPVLRLLDDIFFKFREAYVRFKNLDPKRETITAKYPWYYLNTYVTNEVGGKVFVVDGQQRLTTLSLILMKLRHLAKQFGSELQGWISNKIAGQTGFEKDFWMNHVNHKATQQALFDGVDLDDIDTSSGITAVNMVKNYRTISNWIDRELPDKKAFETFAFFFLHRLVLVHLDVAQTDVSMVFEVINDRGVRLRPFEILKGKLLGQIDKVELDQDNYNGLWEDKAAAVNAFKEDELDSFFRFYLKAKFAKTRKDGQRFDGDYHRAMFEPDMDEHLGLLHKPAKVKEFLKGDFTYFTDLFLKLRTAYGEDEPTYRPVYFNALMDLDAPFHLVLSSCVRNDPDEDQKITTIAKEIDRYFCLLQLQGVYDSNEFADSLYAISEAIRNKGLDAIRPAFEAQLVNAIATRRATEAEAVQPLSYAAFKQTGLNLNKRFKRYFFGRIDEFLAENMNLKPKHNLVDLVQKTGSNTGFHVEHILSWNTENEELFAGDEERFEQERNRLGGILLLKGKDNISSNNEPYAEKLKSYANTLYWNETLRADTYKSKLDMQALKNRFDLELEPYEKFGPDELENRHKLLFKLVGLIWA